MGPANAASVTYLRQSRRLGNISPSKGLTNKKLKPFVAVTLGRLRRPYQETGRAGRAESRGPEFSQAFENPGFRSDFLWKSFWLGKAERPE